EYRVRDPSQRVVGWVVEQGRGLAAALVRVFAGSHRPFEILVLSPEEEPVLEFRRDFFFLFSSMEVRGPAGQLLGRIERRFSLLNRVYDLIGPRGQLFARIESRLFKVWTFPVLDPSGVERARIAKKWSGWGKELFTDADNFGVDFGPHPWTPEQRAVIFAAAIAVDFDFFENNQQR
ncbi:MAG: phospholipid scramblase-related protein, partial [Acidimicrobiia bacterium]